MTQNEWILKELQKRPLTALDALEGCGCFRLASRINDLRKQGHNITTERVEMFEKTFARYRLARKK
jgi:hypothetical protein